MTWFLIYPNMFSSPCFGQTLQKHAVNVHCLLGDFQCFKALTQLLFTGAKCECKQTHYYSEKYKKCT